MGQITIQGHRGQRVINVQTKRRFANVGKAQDDQVVVTEKPQPIQETKVLSETPRAVAATDRDVMDFESGLLASINQFNEDKPTRRKHPRDRDDYYDNTRKGGKQGYHRDKSWRK